MKHIPTFESFVNEGITSFTKAKKETEFTGDTASIKKEAADFLQFLKDEKYSWSSASFLYFPEFVWANGNQQFGPSIGILVGSNSIYVRPIGTDNLLKIGEGLISNLIRNGKLDAYAMKF